MKIGAMSRLGSIKCNWPSRVVIGQNVVVENDVVFKINHPFALGSAVTVADNVFIGEGCYFNVGADISIGSDTLLAARVMVADVGHKCRRGTLVRLQEVMAQPVKIGRDVWIGACAVLLPGIEIHDGAIIGAGSVVTKSVPSGEIWTGVPARQTGVRKD